VRARHALDDGESQARAAAAAARFVQARERALEALGFARGNARAAIEHLDDDAGALAAQLDLHRLAGMAQRVVHQVADRAAQRHARVGEGRRLALAHLDAAAELRVMLAHLVEERPGRLRLARLGLAARELEELADHLVHLVDVRAHALQRLGARAAHLQREAQARERRAHVVRDAGEHHGALALERLEVARHAVEGTRHRRELARPAFGERRGRLAAPHAPRGARERAQRARERGGDQRGAEQGEHEQQRSPAEPAQAELGLEALARQHHPELVLVDEEAHPEAAHAVARAGEARLGAELRARVRGDALQSAPGARQRELLLVGHRVDANALALVQLDEELLAPEGVGVDQRRAREVHHAHRLLRELARARLALGNAQDLERGGDRDDDERGDQQERPPEKRHLLLAVGHEDVAVPPHRLDVARVRGVLLDELPEARDLHVEARSNTSYSRPRASSISWSRDSGWRGRSTSTLSTENSPVVSGTFSPFLRQLARAGRELEGAEAVHAVLAGAPGRPPRGGGAARR
jgi:hypothetical protein